MTRCSSAVSSHCTNPSVALGPRRGHSHPSPAQGSNGGWRGVVNEHNKHHATHRAPSPSSVWLQSEDEVLVRGGLWDTFWVVHRVQLGTRAQPRPAANPEPFPPQSLHAPRKERTDPKPSVHSGAEQAGRRLGGDRARLMTGQNPLPLPQTQFGDERGQASSALPCRTRAGHRRCHLLAPHPHVMAEVSPPGWEPGAFAHSATGVLAPRWAKPRHFLDSE